MSSSNGEVNKSIKLTAKLTRKTELTIRIVEELEIPGSSFSGEGKSAVHRAAEADPPGLSVLGPDVSASFKQGRAGRPWCKFAEFQAIILEGVITMGCRTHVEG